MTSLVTNLESDVINFTQTSVINFVFKVSGCMKHSAN